MGYREIDYSADNAAAGQGWFGIDRFMDIDKLEFLHLFGSNYPDNRERDLWDYSLNGRRARNKGMSVFPQYAAGGVYQLGLSAADLGPAFTIAALINRTGSGAMAAISNFDAGGYGVTLGANGGFYNAYISGAGTSIAANPGIAQDSYTGTGFELLVLVMKGDGTGKIFVIRPPSSPSGSAAFTGLTAGRIYNPRRLLVGATYYDPGFGPGDQTACVFGYSKAMTDADVFNVLPGKVRALLGEYGGPVI
ncbi:hypothetical protein [Methylobacterium gnaphalii]|uniref:Uncharacterized protein n=1 Tax=Methylobacterium gnaphalii TaxID=1010610 RepID=A0A512JQK3_9HYPH|nr:hypothetical protein [Methylobacterium gnaphalii]GEP12247.1 hypothetical protein MGN01_40920 [Methylobacterium gnaphalii]GJD68749.1 hypothetical protein MMMDOFMJ_1673 [Methylobacterium gnaphalii]GLS49354.1 hypothetical protein GCM10007885_22020 [Methylobacterium gnaphalii]